MSTIESDENLMDLCEVRDRTRKYFELSIKISVNTNISVIGFYGNIGGYFYKNIGSIKIFYILII